MLAHPGALGDRSGLRAGPNEGLLYAYVQWLSQDKIVGYASRREVVVTISTFFANRAWTFRTIPPGHPHPGCQTRRRPDAPAALGQTIAQHGQKREPGPGAPAVPMTAASRVSGCSSGQLAGAGGTQRSRLDSVVRAQSGRAREALSPPGAAVS